MKKLPRYKTVEKRLGETPLEALHRLRNDLKIPREIPMAYAGRLDPMATGRLLILIGDECKHQKKYHGLDKAYTFEVLFGVHSDTGDVLGVVDSCGDASVEPPLTKTYLENLAKSMKGPLSLPYPHFSSKTVKGKPLHRWAIEGRLDEIDIPTNHSALYALRLVSMRTVSLSEIAARAHEKIETIPPVTDKRKALGRDFRRDEVRASWEALLKNHPNARCTISTFHAIATSGTYMRSLAEHIGERMQSCALAYSINRTTIGKYYTLGPFGFWLKRF